MSKIIIHITDPHVNFLTINNYTHERNHEFIDSFCKKILLEKPDGVLITGDISEYPDLESDLGLLEKYLDPLPIWFVYGNHDAYHGSISKLREKCDYISSTSSRLRWLGTGAIVGLSETACLIGDDGWYDLECGKKNNSNLLMTDFYTISEFREFDLTNENYVAHQRKILFSKKLAVESTNRLKASIDLVLKENKYKTIYIGTHVPPVWEASLAPDRKQSDGDWAPYMTNLSLGNLLKAYAENNTGIKFNILCGHTHTHTEVDVLNNLKVIVGKADYRNLFYSVINVD